MLNNTDIHSIADVAGILQIVIVLGLFPAISALRSITKSVREINDSVKEFKVYVHENFLTKEDYINFNHENRRK